jgi:hypothetical protein
MSVTCGARLAVRGTKALIYERQLSARKRTCLRAMALDHRCGTLLVTNMAVSAPAKCSELDIKRSLFTVLVTGNVR